MIADLPLRLSQMFTGHWDRHYVAAKVKTDPVYGAIFDTLEGSDKPLLDIGCGLGLLAFYLRTRGLEFPMQCLDYDERKIRSANETTASQGFRDLTFATHDARLGLPEHCGNVSILDILQFFTPEEQQQLLCAAASRVAPGGKLVIRSTVRDSSWRFGVTVCGDILAKLSFWMKAAPTHYPTQEDFHHALKDFGTVTIRPLWGNTPFNNMLIVLERGD